MTAANSDAAQVDWSFYAGDATTLTFVFWDDEDQTEATDLSLNSYRAEVRTARNQEGDAAATCSTSITDNELTVSLTAVQTRALREDGRRFFWDLEESVSDANPVTIVVGTVLIKDDTTR